MTNDLVQILARLTITISLAILLVLVSRGAVRKAFGASVAYRLWLIVPVAAVAGVLPIGPADLGLPGLDILAFGRRAASAKQALPGEGWELVALGTGRSGAPTIDWALATGLAWSAGALACAIMVLREHARAVRGLGALTDERLDGVAVHRMAQPGPGPSLIGVFKPRLIVPADFERRFSPPEQRLVLAHERQHRLAGDPLVNALIVLLRCLNWFNPLVHAAAVMVRIDQELACDAAVLARHPGERRVYAEALLKSQLAATAMPLGCQWPVRSIALLKQRVELLAQDAPGRPRLLAGAALVATLSLAAGLTAWAAQPARPISDRAFPVSAPAPHGGAASSTPAARLLRPEAVPSKPVGETMMMSQQLPGKARRLAGAAVAAATIGLGTGSAIAQPAQSTLTNSQRPVVAAPVEGFVPVEGNRSFRIESIGEGRSVVQFDGRRPLVPPTAEAIARLTALSAALGLPVGTQAEVMCRIAPDSSGVPHADDCSYATGAGGMTRIAPELLASLRAQGLMPTPNLSFSARALSNGE